MTAKEYPVIPLFETFIKDSLKGKRLKADGSRIKRQTIHNYSYVLGYLTEFEEYTKTKLRVKVFRSQSTRAFKAEIKYWKTFYRQFTQFLYSKKKCFDNYVGSVMKNIRAFFNYLNREMGIKTGDHYKSFYVNKEDVPIVTLLPEQLQFLINDGSFNNRLSGSLMKAKNIFIFGCTVALRVSDLFALKFTDMEKVGGAWYLPVKTQKTGSIVRIKLPAYAMTIIETFRAASGKRVTIFPPIPRYRFNNQLKEISCLAGWTSCVGKQRKKRGVKHELTLSNRNHQYRFCDLVSSHTMRRTAITTMLMLGMKEHVVKQISGHSGDSKSFYRYINLVQSYLDNDMDIVFQKLSDDQQRKIA
ncbi:tyrosine-type recombinase/integrase [Ferruginibacter sp. HRS2-29]|uniref:tyrosine-type recombinase/integrase n=1 Tax=Ferruginibacter sp. HRS2-29 TaxID=2487334 RepID=UPI0020CE85E6|nr:tyrosine-type recombinase/integrase [Ferruginibacter sp. HRS2-29]MCP9752438.1 hypothetical protein [Ferruginibacter sp. HRS2-29]